MPAKLLTAIGFDRNGKPYKYRNIDADKLPEFEKFCITDKYNKPPLMYVNYYVKRTKKFSHQQRLIHE